jgi:hypothetical protein
MKQLAYLPLKSVQELEVGWGSLNNTLLLLLGASDLASELPSWVSQASGNLAACPACNKQPQPVVGLRLAKLPSALTPQQRVHLFEALAPLRVMQLERLSIRSELELSPPEVEALAHSLGGSIKSLELRECTLVSSFWRPLAQHFPRLEDLTLGDGVKASITDLVFYLGMLSQSRPDSLCIYVNTSILDSTRLAELQAHIAAWQLQNVRLLQIEYY